MKHQWLAYVIVAVLSIGAGVAIAGLPDSVPDSPTVIPPSTTAAPETTVVTTTIPPTTSTTPAPTTTRPPATTTTTEPDETTTTTTIDPLPARAEVPVAVTNATGRSGVAQSTADLLEGLGYVNVDAITSDDVADVTIVYYSAGNDGLAVRMAADLGLAPDAIAPIDTAPSTQDFGLAQLLVSVGADRA